MPIFPENCQAKLINAQKKLETFFKGAKKRRNFLRLFF